MILGENKKTLELFIQEILKEEIALPPRKYFQFVKITLSNLEKTISEILSSIEIITSLNEDENDELESLLNYTTNREVDVRELKSLSRKIRQELKIDSLKHAFEVYQGKYHDFKKSFDIFINDNLKKDDYSLGRYLDYISKQIRQNQDKILNGPEETGYEVKPEILQKIIGLPNQIGNLYSIANVFNKKIDAMVARGSRRYEDKPQTEEVETLYHTTIKAKEIFQNGFDLAGPVGQAGLGGNQNDNSGKPAISFTADFYVAKEIMRTLREGILIATNQMSMNDLRRMAHNDGVFDEVEKSFNGLQGRKTNTPSLRFEYYKIYLAHSQSEKKRYDPLFVGNTNKLLQLLATKKPEDVGILVCKVNMRNPNMLYFPAMEEYRVSADSVVSIDKIIS